MRNVFHSLPHFNFFKKELTHPPDSVTHSHTRTHREYYITGISVRTFIVTTGFYFRIDDPTPRVPAPIFCLNFVEILLTFSSSRILADSSRRSVPAMEEANTPVKVPHVVNFKFFKICRQFVEITQWSRFVISRKNSNPPAVSIEIQRISGSHETFSAFLTFIRMHLILSQLLKRFFPPSSILILCPTDGGEIGTRFFAFSIQSGCAVIWLMEQGPNRSEMDFFK